MSGVAKAVGIAFVAVVAPIALPALAAAAPAAASVFSAGAAAGGGSILTSALLNAGKSAIVGGLISKVGGGKFADGAKVGALAGAAGTVMGGFGQAMGGQVPGGVDPVLSTKGATATATAPATQGTGFGMAAAPAAAPAATGPLGGFGRFLFDGENPLAGQLLKGAAEGYLMKAQADDQNAFEQQQYDDIRNSYEGAGAALEYDQPTTTRFEAMGRKAPAYQYNRDTRRIERV
jgi:hypothetical protein